MQRLGRGLTSLWLQASTHADQHASLQARRLQAITDQLDQGNAQIIQLSINLKHAHAQEANHKWQHDGLQRKLAVCEAEVQLLEAKLLAAHMESAGMLSAHCESQCMPVMLVHGSSRHAYLFGTTWTKCPAPCDLNIMCKTSHVWPVTYKSMHTFSTSSPDELEAANNLWVLTGTADTSRSQTVQAAIQQRDRDITTYFDTHVLKHILNPDHQKRSLALTREICGLKVAHQQLIAAHAAAKKLAGAASLHGVTLRQQLQVSWS